MGAVVIITEYPVSLPRREVWRVQDLFRFLRACEQGCLYSFFRVHPCSSVGGYVSLPLSNVLISLRSNDRVAYGEAVIIVRAHRRDKNGCLCCLLNQLPSLFLVWIVFSLDSLDFCEFASKDVYIPFSVSIRAHPWLIIFPRLAPKGY